MNARAALPRFVALSPGELDSGSSAAFAARARAALGAGLPGLLLREPLLPDREFLELARVLAPACRERGAWFCVHDRVHVALAVGADAVHLGFRSLAPRAARELLPPGMSLGLSTHAADGAEALAACDYRIHGPVFDTPSKRGLQPPIGIEGVARAVALSPLPLCAIGGLEPAHFAALRAAGAHGACARSAVFAAGEAPPQTARRVEAWLAALRAARDVALPGIE